jgi:hypothetical protein
MPRNDYGGALIGTATLLGVKRHPLPAAVLLAAALLFTGACGAKDGAPKDTSSSPSATTPAAAKIIEYPDGVALRTPEDVNKLEGAPEDFKQFISGAASQVMTDKSATDKCGPYISVDQVDPAGFASGSVFDCGGANLIWAKVDGVWRQIFGGQYVPPCDLVKKYSVPEAIVGGPCDDHGN